MTNIIQEIKNQNQCFYIVMINNEIKTFTNDKELNDWKESVLPLNELDDYVIADVLPTYYYSKEEMKLMEDKPKVTKVNVPPRTLSSNNNYVTGEWLTF